ncbi:uncharacterized protein LOC127093466 isoform X3 [Lathyrus oleraceus]|uniref:Uncharacterized protein n=2 Tax=Pisum sativum TaxID=3888 RepID=A0A9D4W1J3_PEA|nr:uncharacterized protein LOC127093466 isoform X3 [Pisum sativum]KAI5392785.1 hypothetical protein KIW84_060090 [Pisum sativum]
MNNKTQNLRRGTNKRRHTNKLFGVFGAAAIKFLKKSKKEEKVRSLSAVNEMGCEKQQQQHQDPKGFKIPNNFLNGCYGASVPRKLRSAMKKRGRESILLDAEKVNHKNNGMESSEKDNVKKSKKQEISKHLSRREGGFGSITKDEEEVAETLYALAAMFPHSGSDHVSKELYGEALIENSSVLQDKKENVNASLEASGTDQGASLCPESCLPGEASKITSVNETTGHEHSKKVNILVASHSSTPSINLQSMPEMVKRECCEKIALHDSELCLAIGLNITRQSPISQHKKKPDVELDLIRNVNNKQKQHLIKEPIKNESLALWPGLSSVSSAVSHKRSRKRCATHVYISHTIRCLEVSKQGAIKESKLHECNEMRVPDGSKREASLEIHNVNGMRNGAICTTARNTNESKNGSSTLLQQCHYGEISQATPTPGVYDPQKQSFNFLSLSAGSYGLKVDNNNYNKVVSRLEPLSNLQLPYFQSPARQQRVVPNPTHQSRYASSTVYLDQLSVVGPQLRLQQPHYYGSQSCGTQYSSTASNSKQEHQNFWGMQQQVAQRRSSVNCNIVMRTQNPNWQSGRNDSSAMVPCAQAIFPHTSVSQEIFGSKIAGRQQQLISPIQDKWARPSSSQYYI